MKSWLFVAVFLTACGSDAFECSIGELDGTWRWSYQETNGNCGSIPDETVQFVPGGANQPGISADQCELDVAITGETTDGLGTQAWSIHLEQADEETLDGSGTVQVNHPSGTCRSTYNILVERL